MSGIERLSELSIFLLRIDIFKIPMNYASIILSSKFKLAFVFLGKTTLKHVFNLFETTNDIMQVI